MYILSISFFSSISLEPYPTMEEQDKKKKKKFKKVFKRIAIALSSIILLIAVIVALSPTLIQAYLNTDSGKRNINNIVGDYLNAKVNFKEIRLNVWKSLPDIELELINGEIFSNAIKNDQSDTLIKVDTLRLSVNAIKYLKHNEIIINEARFANPTVNAYVNAEGKANWDIYIQDTTQQDTTFDYNIKLQKLEIDNLRVKYYDERTNSRFILDSTNISMSGDINADLFKLTTEIKLKADYYDEMSRISINAQQSSLTINGNLTKGDYTINSSMGKISSFFSDSSYNAKIILDSIGINANTTISDSTYGIDTKLLVKVSEYNDSSFSIKEIPLDIELKAKTNADFTNFNIDTISLTNDKLFVNASGIAESLTDSSWNTNLALNLSIPQIDDVINSITPTLSKELKKYKFSGGLNISGSAKGIYDGKTYPDFKANVTLSNIRALVLEQNEEVRLDMETDVKYIAGNHNETYINVKKLNATVGETFIDLKGTASNIFNDPHIDAKLKCNLNLDYISKLFPIEDLMYKGQLSSDFDAKFSIDDLKKMKFSKIYMLGNINIKKILMVIPSQKFSVFGRNANVEIGINSTKMRRSNQTVLCKPQIFIDSVRISLPHIIEASATKLDIQSHANEPVRNIPSLGTTISVKGLKAIVTDTIFIEGKMGRIRMSVRPDKNDTLVPCITTNIKLDSLEYYDPTNGLEFKPTELNLKVCPRNLDNDDISKARTTIDADSLIKLCKKVTDADNALKFFKLDGFINSEHIKYFSEFSDTRMGMRLDSIKFTDDTLKIDSLITFRIGKSFLKIKGRVENIRQALINNEMMTADINIQSRNININELLYINNSISQKKQQYYSQKSKQAVIPNEEEFWKKIIPPGLTDAQTKAFKDSVNRVYRRTDFNEIYERRITRMKSRMEKVRNEDFIDPTDTQNSAEPDYDTVPMSLIKIPDNLNCKLSTDFNTVLFRGLKINNIKSDIKINNSTLHIKNDSIQTNVGKLSLDVIYQCAPTDSTAKVALDISGKDITVEDLLYSLPMIDSILPMLSSFEGNLNCNLYTKTELDSIMEPIIPTLETECHINGKNLVVLDSKTFASLATYLLFKKKTKNVIDNMSVMFEINNGSLNVSPFILSMDKYVTAMSGNMNLTDYTYLFHISTLKPIKIGINVEPWTIRNYITAYTNYDKTAIDNYIKNGNVTINGVVVKSPKDKVMPGSEVLLNGKLITSLNKFITINSDYTKQTKTIGLIQKGLVSVNGKIVTNPDYKVKPNDTVYIKTNVDKNKYVGTLLDYITSYVDFPDHPKIKATQIIKDSLVSINDEIDVNPKTGIRQNDEVRINGELITKLNKHISLNTTYLNSKKIDLAIQQGLVSINDEPITDPEFKVKPYDKICIKLNNGYNIFADSTNNKQADYTYLKDFATNNSLVNRKEARTMITEGHISINGNVVTDPDTNVKFDDEIVFSMNSENTELLENSDTIYLIDFIETNAKYIKAQKVDQIIQKGIVLVNDQNATGNNVIKQGDEISLSINDDTHILEKGNNNIELNQYIISNAKYIKPGKVKDIIINGQVSINGKSITDPHFYLNKNDTISININEIEDQLIEESYIDINIVSPLYKDATDVVKSYNITNKKPLQRSIQEFIQDTIKKYIEENEQ